MFCALSVTRSCSLLNFSSSLCTGGWGVATSWAASPTESDRALAEKTIAEIVFVLIVLTPKDLRDASRSWFPAEPVYLSIRPCRFNCDARAGATVGSDQSRTNRHINRVTQSGESFFGKSHERQISGPPLSRCCRRTAR